MQRKLGVIGSYELGNEGLRQDAEEITIATPYGEKSALLYGDGMVCLRRGRDGMAAYAINHRANISALTQLGVTDVVATAMVGAINPDLPIGTVVVLDQFLDFTKRTPGWLHDDDRFRDFDFTYPFCDRLRDELIRADYGGNTPARRGCYVGVDGPRFETAAEVRMYGMLGGDVIGMTVVNECIMAREAGICYSAVAGVVNTAAGVTAKAVHASDFLGPGATHVERLTQVLPGLVRRVAEAPAGECVCQAPAVAESATVS